MNVNLCIRGMYMLKRIWEKIKFEIKMRHMDHEWRLFGGGCFGDYPPSFYYRHTPEEARRIMAEDIANLRKILKEWEEEELKGHLPR